MADNIAEAISLLTRVSADMAKRLDALEKGGGSISQKSANVPRKVVKKAEPVVVTDFGPKAEKDLNRLGGDASKERERADKEKNNNGMLLRALGLAGAAALALKFLFDGKGFTGLVQGFQNVVGKVDKWAKATKSAIDDVAKKAGTIADDVGKSIKSFADDVAEKAAKFTDDAVKGLQKIGTKASAFIDNVKSINIKQTIDDMVKKVGTFADDMMAGISKVAGKVSSVAKGALGLTPKPAAPAGSGGGGSSKGGGTTKPAAPKSGGGNWLSKGWNFVKGGASKVAKVVTTGASKVVEGAKVVGGAAKDKLLAPLVKGIKGFGGGALKMMKGLLRSPFLAPIVEGFFTYKDVNDMIAQHAAGEIDEKTLNAMAGKRLVQAVTGIIGGALGAVGLGTLFSPIPVVGPIVGTLAGGVLGDVLGKWLGGFLADWMGEDASKLGSFALNSPAFKMGDASAIEVDDGIITKDGQIIKPDADDTLYAMKNGGPLADALSKGSLEQLSMLKKISVINDTLMSRQIDLLQDNQAILVEIADKIGNGGNVNINNISKLSSTTTTGGGLQGIRQQYAV